jgi:hypothetical protein
MTKLISAPFIALSAVGLLASLTVHLYALFNLPNPLGSFVWALHVGIFVVFFPAILTTNKALSNEKFQQKDFWAVALKGCPPWMRTMVYGFFGYAFLNFAYFIAFAEKDPHNANTAATVRGFSGHWMAFYSASLALLYSSTNHVEAKCVNGHVASSAAKFCEECGGPVTVTVTAKP